MLGVTSAWLCKQPVLGLWLVSSTAAQTKTQTLVMVLQLPQSAPQDREGCLEGP